MNDIQKQVQTAIDDLVESGPSGACKSPYTATVSRWPMQWRASPTRKASER